MTWYDFKKNQEDIILKYWDDDILNQPRLRDLIYQTRDPDHGLH
jgi:hypothetical protein